MAVVAYLVRADLRRRWKAWAALAVLLAAAGGVSLFAITGWQRTATAMDRFLDEFHPGDAIVVGPDLDREAVLALPDVVAADGGEYFFLVPDGPDGRPEPGALGAVNPFSSSSGNVLHGMYDARIIEGRKPSIDEELEIAIDEELARTYGVRAGDTFSMTALSPEQLVTDDGDLVGLTMPEGPHFDFEITAVLRRPSDVVPTSGGDADVVYLGTQDLYLTPAFHRAHFQRDVAGGSAFDEPGTGYLEVRLRPGADPAALSEQVASVVPSAQVFLDESEDAAATRLSQRAIGLQATAVLAFGIVVAVAAFLLALLATSRLLSDQAADLGALRASGLSRAATVAAAVATAAAAATSARAQAVARRRSAPQTATLSSRLARRTNNIGLATGLQLGGRVGGVQAAARLTVLLACLGVVGSLTFASSAERLHGEPESFGWGWELAVGNPNDGDLFRRILDEVADHPAIGEATAVYSGCGALLEHDSRRAEPALVALDPLQGSIGPTMLSGRAPSGAGEVSLGSVTARQLGAQLGDTVLVGSGDCGEGLRPMELTGLVLFNRALFAERVGEGALVDLPALEALAVEAESGLVLLNRAPGVSLADAHAALRKDFGRTVLGPQAPDDLDALDRVRGLPLLVAAFLGVLALGTLVFTLGSVLRRSRRDLAVLKALGLAPHQAGRAMLVHAASLILVPAVAGALLGIAAGRLSWSTITRGLGAPDLPVVPLIATGLAVPVALFAAIVVASYPAHLAARTPPAIALRTE